MMGQVRKLVPGVGFPAGGAPPAAFAGREPTPLGQDEPWVQEKIRENEYPLPHGLIRARFGGDSSEESSVASDHQIPPEETPQDPDEDAARAILPSLRRKLEGTFEGRMVLKMFDTGRKFTPPHHLREKLRREFGLYPGNGLEPFGEKHFVPPKIHRFNKFA